MSLRRQLGLSRERVAPSIYTMRLRRGTSPSASATSTASFGEGAPAWEPFFFSRTAPCRSSSPTEIRRLARRVRRLLPRNHDPEAFYIEKDEVVNPLLPVVGQTAPTPRRQQTLPEKRETTGRLTQNRSPAQIGRNRNGRRVAFSFRGWYRRGGERNGQFNRVVGLTA
jgi:hypothetical protein